MFSPDGEEAVEFYCLEQTVIGAKTYLLVTDEEDGDSEALILRDDSDMNDEEAEDLFQIINDLQQKNNNFHQEIADYFKDKT